MARRSHFGFDVKSSKRDLSSVDEWKRFENPIAGRDRLHVAHLPTPLEPMDQLSRNLGGPHLFVKRDDCTGFVTGGSTGRKLEFLMADAIAKRSVAIITAGLIDSDYMLQTAAIARKLDMRCILVAEDRTDDANALQPRPAAILLDRLYGAEIHYSPSGSDSYVASSELHAKWTERGQPAYVIPRGGSNPVGALGCMNLAIEIAGQLREQGLRIDCVVLASDSGTTQAGLIVGFKLASMPVRILGISVNTPRLKQEDRVYELVCDLLDFLQIKQPLSKTNIVVNSDYVDNERKEPTLNTLVATAEVARQECILLNPTYTGRAMGGLIDLIVNKRQFSANENILFLHSDGSAVLFEYPAALGKHLTTR